MAASTPPPTDPKRRELPPFRDWGGADLFRKAPYLKWIFAGVGGCGVMVILTAFAVFAFVWIFIFGAMKQSDVYQLALSRAKSNSSVRAALGEPISEGWFMGGSIKVEGSSGSADLSIPVSGPKAKATIYAVATKSAGEWTYSRLQVKIDSTGETIDLVR